MPSWRLTAPASTQTRDSPRLQWSREEPKPRKVRSQPSASSAGGREPLLGWQAGCAHCRMKPRRPLPSLDPCSSLALQSCTFQCTTSSKMRSENKARTGKRCGNSMPGKGVRKMPSHQKQQRKCRTPERIGVPGHVRLAPSLSSRTRSKPLSLFMSLRCRGHVSSGQFPSFPRRDHSGMPTPSAGEPICRDRHTNTRTLTRQGQL